MQGQLELNSLIDANDIKILTRSEYTIDDITEDVERLPIRNQQDQSQSGFCTIIFLGKSGKIPGQFTLLS
jgi:hypothetical protein